VADLGFLDVVLDGQEERAVLGQLGQHPLRLVVEVGVVLQLGQERLQTILL
jgi:hypothetical protein